VTAAAIETFGLGKTFEATRAVIDLDLRVEPGQVFGFLGPNGAGKTTTIRMLLALQRPTFGRAAVLGFDPRRDSVDIHRRVGYLPGDLELYPHMTGRQLIDWFARARHPQPLPLAEELIERFAVVVDRPAKALSKGNRQKLGLVLAFAHRPDLVVLDEPTTGLDPLMQHEFARLIGEFVAEGRTVFLSSHELDEVQRLASRVAIIRAGRLVTVDTVEHLRDSAPFRVEARFRRPVDTDRFTGIDGVTIKTADGPAIVFEVTGRIGPALEAIGRQDPVDVVCRHADLDELFLDYYRDATEAGPTDGG
jgi:beta-exotoxin I transport system ATP-binding protein